MNVEPPQNPMELPDWPADAIFDDPVSEHLKPDDRFRALNPAEVLGIWEAMADATFVENDFLQMFSFNQTFVLNIVDWLSLGDELIGIRSRQVTDRPLEDIGDGNKTLIKILNTFGVTILVIAFGLVRFALKRREKRIFQEGLRS